MSAETTMNRPEADAAPKVLKKSRSRPYVILSIVVAAVAAGYFGFRFLTAGREGTDDAQVGADMVPISARVGGNVVAVPVVDNQAVKKGDLLAQIDPTDYENKVKVAEAEIQASRAQAEAADAQVRIVAGEFQGRALYSASGALRLHILCRRGRRADRGGEGGGGASASGRRQGRHRSQARPLAQEGRRHSPGAGGLTHGGSDSPARGSRAGAGAARRPPGR